MRVKTTTFAASQVRAQEPPRRIDRWGRPVGPNVAAPRYSSSGPTKRRGETGRLRILQHDDIARSDRGHELHRCGTRDAIEQLAIAKARPTHVESVQQVVEALRQAEVLRWRVQDEPANIEASAAPVRKQRALHLRHAATASVELMLQSVRPARSRSASSHAAPSCSHAPTVTSPLSCANGRVPSRTSRRSPPILRRVPGVSGRMCSS